MTVILGILLGVFAARGDKTQAIRLIDVFALGPAMVLLGTRRELSLTERQFLQFAGAATISFNARNWIKNR